MRNNAQIIFGMVVILLGVSIILGMFFDINFFAVCFSVGLILIGVWILVRPRFLPEDSNLRLLIFGDFRRKGDWQVQGEEIWMFIGDIRLDMSEASIPTGTTSFRIMAFIGDINLKLPEDVGLHLSSYAFVNDIKIDGKKKDYIFVPMDYKTDSYDAAERRIRLETMCFIGDIDVVYTPALTTGTEEQVEM